ncbi:MAG: AtpZ/AtpI family protein [Turicibacter sanguinis]|uniref:AtpZ/AtpI family protein n=1 Tax=Turicibacter sanguinis TaxID=154288 RepID=UPI0039945588
MSGSPKVVKAMKWMTLMSQVGITMVANIMVGLFIGKYLDQWLHTSPLFLLLFIFIGFFGGIKSVYLLIIKIDKRDKS